jgi:hypothetical protein
MLAGGNCIDASVCGTGSLYSACKQATSQMKMLSSDAAVTSYQFSTAYTVLEPGNYTMLLRANNYMGCGGSTADCSSYGSLAFKVDTGGCARPMLKLMLAIQDADVMRSSDTNTINWIHSKSIPKPTINQLTTHAEQDQNGTSNLKFAC